MQHSATAGNAPTVMSEEMVITPLGGGQEVGRSCILLRYQNRQILLDCGCHPGREGIDSLPFFDAIENIAAIDLVLITHFHIDHCAALPYFTEKTQFQGKIFMTHATKAVMKLLLSDNIRLQKEKDALYTEEDLQNCVDKIDVIDYYQTKEFRGIKFTPSPAGHVLGAAMFTIEIDNIRVLYTGDYSLEEDRHLPRAEMPAGGPPDVLIVESTFGTTSVPPRAKREVDFTRTVENIVLRGGSCLIPVFALGRAQELLLILDEYWKEHPRLHNIPIFYASKLATRSLRVYQTFINMMNDHVRQLNDHFTNPFKFRYIKSMANIESSSDIFGPCVVMASPGFLQSGVSRQLFEAWCDDERHGVIIAGYTIEGTLAHNLLSMPTEVKCSDNRIKARRCQIENITFSAHVDYSQNSSFIKTVAPDYIILVHGEKLQMKRLQDALEHDMRQNLWPTEHKPAIAAPQNGMPVRLRFRKNIVATVAGSVTMDVVQALETRQQTPSVPSSSSLPLPDRTVVVTENFTSQVVSIADLSQFTSCKFSQIEEKVVIPLSKEIAQLLTSAAASLTQRTKSPALQQLASSATSSSHYSLVEVMLLHMVYRQVAGMYGSVEWRRYEGKGEAERVLGMSLSIEKIVSVYCLFQGVDKTSAGGSVALTGIAIRWNASSLADTIADSLAGLLLQYFSVNNLIRLNIDSLLNSLSDAMSASSSSSTLTTLLQSLH